MVFDKMEAGTTAEGIRNEPLDVPRGMFRDFGLGGRQASE